MAVEIFQKLYNQSLEKQELFSFQILLNEINLLTPEKKGKLPVPYSSEKIDLIKNCHDSILRNFCNNPIIKKSPKFNPLILKKFVNFLNSSQYFEQKLAQCLFLIHASKTDCRFLNDNEAKNLFVNYLERFNTITILFKNNFDSILNEFLLVFDTLIQNKNFIVFINKSIEEIVVYNSNSKSYNYNNLKLLFFKSELVNVYGFSGKDRIYLSSEHILKTFKISINEEQKWTVAKLNFIKLILHEASHVVLRFKLNDLNLSSPYLNEKIKNKEAKKSVNECGFETEKRLFKECIDWNLSAIKGFNFNYCEKFLNNILNNFQDEFNLEKANVEIVNQDLFHSSGFSIDFQRGTFF